MARLDGIRRLAWASGKAHGHCRNALCGWVAYGPPASVGRLARQHTREKKHGTRVQVTKLTDYDPEEL